MRSLRVLNATIIECKKCPRLASYIADVARKKTRRYADQEYWGRPLPGFGDPDAKLLIIGLAPAAHGGNRTGRMFTGDSSGDWLARALHETGFANQPTSSMRDDGLRLRGAYITAVARCAPPENKPTAGEIENCSCYLAEELKLLKPKVILTLGAVAFNSYARLQGLRGLRFAHGATYEIGGHVLVASYHPSRQNTQTGRLTWDAWIRIFRQIRKII